MAFSHTRGFFPSAATIRGAGALDVATSVMHEAVYSPDLKDFFLQI